MKIKFDEKSLIPVISQDIESGQVLMLAYMNEEAYNKTIKEKKMYYYSRSRQSLWLKGESSGHTQELVSLSMDCDGDALLAKVIQKGPACHTGHKNCFYRSVIEGALGFDIIEQMLETIDQRIEEKAEDSYSNYLWQEGKDKILKKIGEEASEIIIASKNEKKHEIINEIADFIYHLLILMKYDQIKRLDLYACLMKRFQP